MKKLKLLIVDDDKDFADSMAEALSLQGHNVSVAYTGEQAIHIFGDETFDMAFMDVKLPEKNGVESFLEIRKIRPEARVVMMTGFQVETLIEQAVDNGVWGVLNKPLDMRQVIALLDQVEPKGILLADDDADFVHGIKETLQLNNHTVYTANNGEDALAKVRKGGVHVLILDLRMPLMGGLDVYLELKKTGDELPTIIVTAFASEEHDALMRLESFDITGVLTKPFNPIDLHKMLESLDDQTGNE